MRPTTRTRATRRRTSSACPRSCSSLFIPLAWIRFDVGGVTLTAAMLFAAVVLRLLLPARRPARAGHAGRHAHSGLAGEQIAGLGAVHGWIWFAMLFVGGWILQLVGHVFEGRKPALADNLFQIFVAPIFLAAEVFFALGYKPQLQCAGVRKRAQFEPSAKRGQLHQLAAHLVQVGRVGLALGVVGEVLERRRGSTPGAGRRSRGRAARRSRRA